MTRKLRRKNAVDNFGVNKIFKAIQQIKKYEREIFYLDINITKKIDIFQKK